jgi:hypothetical protein
MDEAPEKQCAMGFCDNAGEVLLRAFGNDEPQLYCQDHADMAEAYEENDDEH